MRLRVTAEKFLAYASLPRPQALHVKREKGLTATAARRSFAVNLTKESTFSRHSKFLRVSDRTSNLESAIQIVL